MVGSQALVAFRDADGKMTVKTYYISSFSLTESKVWYEVKDATAEFSGGAMRLFATLVLPEGVATKVNQVWQVGPSVIGGVPDKHAFQPANLNSKAFLDLLRGQSTITPVVNSRTKKRNVLASKSPSLLDFHEDLVSLEAASKIQLKSLAKEMQAIIKGLEKVKQELLASENDGHVSENFHKTLKEFVNIAEIEVSSVTNLYSVAGRNADALVLYFGEDPARCPFEQVPATLLNFVRLFRKAHKENCKQDELEKKKAQKEAEIGNPKGINLKPKGMKH